MSSANNLCKQIGHRSGLTIHRAWSGSNLFDTHMVFLKNFFRKSWFWKKSADDKKSVKNFVSIQFDIRFNLFDTQMVFLKEFFKKVDFEKNQQTTKKKYENFFINTIDNNCITHSFKRFALSHWTYLPSSVVCWWPLQTDWTQIRPDNMSGLIKIQSVWH